MEGFEIVVVSDYGFGTKGCAKVSKNTFTPFVSSLNRHPNNEKSCRRAGMYNQYIRLIHSPEKSRRKEILQYD